jgi:hypothetical protein
MRERRGPPPYDPSDAARIEWPASYADPQDVAGGWSGQTRSPLPEIPIDGPPGGASQRNHPFPAAFSDYPHGVLIENLIYP